MQKVLSLRKQSTLNVRGKQLVKVDVAVADQSASTKLILWENNFQLAKDHFYAINNVTVHSFNDVKYLSTSKYSTINQIEDIKDTAEAFEQQYGKKK